tara:strand:- start:696 stop:1133 length:438 start_codon:yes stop_codon:yes gene_type:complete
MEKYMEKYIEIINAHEPNKTVVVITLIQIFILISLLIHSILNKKYITKQQKKSSNTGYGESRINPVKFGLHITVIIIAQLILGVFHFYIVNMFCEIDLLPVAWFLVILLFFNLILFNKYYHLVFLTFCTSFLIKMVYANFDSEKR